MDEDRAIAEDFERGWSEERLNAAYNGWGPGLLNVLQGPLAEELSRQAKAEGKSDLELINEAVRSYLKGKQVA